MAADLSTLPHRFGRYEVLGLLGSGAFADVVRAWDASIASHVAIKVLNAESSTDPLIRQRFVDEAKLLQRVSHECVVTVHDLGELDDGRPYLVEDLADGGTLADRIGRLGPHPVDAATVRRVVESVAAGLHALHEAGIVHRDIKPENLLISSSGSAPSPGAETVVGLGMLADGERLVISDLGLAKDVAARGSAPSVLGGSARYQAPEQLRVDGRVGPPTDLYAASSVLWRLLSGRVAPEPHDIGDELSRFRSGWQAFFTRAMALNPDDRFPSAPAWRAAALDHAEREPSALAETAPTAWSGRACPYKGLAAFQPEDAAVFFGRESLVDELVRRLQVNRVLVVAGPSGSGKSSVIRAGLLPALRNGALPKSSEWRYELFTPGASPLDELHYRLAKGLESSPPIGIDQLKAEPRLARHLADASDDDRGRLLYVDQFEELFTQADPATPLAFIEALAAMSDPTDSRVRLVLAVRADFYGRCAQIAWLADRITANQVLVGPMGNDDMRRAIEEPARRAGLRFEPGLVEAMLDEAGRSPGSLPLISHALVETWARRAGNLLTLDGFRAAGGVAGAVAHSADAIYEDSFGEPQRAAARRLLLRLVTPGEATADTRRRFPLTELERDPDPRVMAQVVDAFVAARLLSVDDQSVEIAHEALIGGWPRLRDWIDAERENLRFRYRVNRAAIEWEAHQRDPDLLYRGTPLATAVEWANLHGDKLDRLEQEFLDESSAARLRAEEARAQRAARAQRTRRLATAALAGLALASILASIVALAALQRARTSTQVAERQFANALGTSAAGHAGSDPALALLLAVESIARSPDPTADARSALVQARLAMAAPGVVPLGPSVSTPGSFKVALRPDGGLAAVADQTGPIRLYDTATGEQIGGTLARHEHGARTLAFTFDGTTLVSGGSDGMVLAWDLTDPAAVPAPRVVYQSDVTAWAVAVHPDDRQLAVGVDDGVLRLFDLQTGEERSTIQWSEGAGIISVAFSPDGETIVASNRDGRLQSWRTEGGAALWAPDATPAGPKLWEIVFSPDGTRFATAGDRDTAQVHDTATGQTITGGIFGEPPGPDAVATQIHGVAFSPDGAELVGGSAAGTVHTWVIGDPPTDSTATAARHRDAVEHGALSADGSVYVTVGDDKRLRTWRFEPVPVSDDHEGFADGAYGLAFDPAGGRIAVGDGTGEVHLVTIGGGAGTRTGLSHPGDGGHDGLVFDLAWSPDGAWLASTGDDGRVILWDPAAGAAVATLGRHAGPGGSVSFSPDSSVLVSADRGDEQGQGAEVLVWDVASRAVAHRLDGHAQGVRATAFSDDGSLLATADGRGEIRLWDTGGFDLVRQWTAPEQINPVWALSFSNRGLLASVDASEDLRVWDPATGQQVGETISGLGTDGATGVGFSADGATAAVLTRSGQLLLVDWAQGIDLAASPIPAHPDTDAWQLVFAPDGERFATTGTDGTVRLWDLLSPDRACEVAGGRLDATANAQLLDGTDPVGCR